MKIINKITLCICLLIICLICFGCSNKCAVQADISTYGNTEIKIIGLTEEEFTITPNELAEMECVSKSATGKTEKSGHVNSVGPLFEAFVAKYDKKLTDFEKVKFIAKDNYQVLFCGDSLTDYKAVLSVANGKEPLSESMQPMRLFIPGTDSSNWVYGVIQIEFTPVKNTANNK